MAISQELASLPPFLQRFLIDRGAVVDPDAVVPVSSSVSPLLPALPPRRTPLDDGGSGEDYSSTFGNIASTSGFSSPSINSDAFTRGFARLAEVPEQIATGISDTISSFASGVENIFNGLGATSVDESPSTSGSNFSLSGLFDMGTGPYTAPTALQQITGNPLSMGGVGRNMQAIDALGQARGDSSSFMNGRKAAAGMMPVASILGLGTTGGLFGMLGGGLNAMGFHHDYDPNVDSNLFMDPDQGLVGFDSKSAGGGGMQEGMLNMTNMVEDMVNKGLGGEYINTPQGYIRANDLNDYFKTERDDEFGYGQLAYNGIPSGYEPSGYGDLSSNQAIDSLNNMSGDAWNSVASDVYASGGGYNDAVQAAENEAEALAESVGWADFDAGFDDIGTSETGVDSDFGSVSDWASEVDSDFGSTSDWEGGFN